LALHYATHHGLSRDFSARKTESDSASPGGSGPFCSFWPRLDRRFKRGCLKTRFRGMKAILRGSRPSLLDQPSRHQPLERRSSLKPIPTSGQQSKCLVLTELLDPMIAPRTALSTSPVPITPRWGYARSTGNPGCSASQRRVPLLPLSYNFLSLDRLMRTFLGLPLVAAMLDLTSST
jgi:hypothetical protein